MNHPPEEKAWLRFVVAGLIEKHPRVRLHAEVRPQPGGLAPLRLELSPWKDWRASRCGALLCSTSPLPSSSRRRTTSLSVDTGCGMILPRRKPASHQLRARASASNRVCSRQF